MDDPNSERVITPMPKSLVAAIDDFRFSNRIASRAEAVRLLIRRALGIEAGIAASEAPEPAPAVPATARRKPKP